jgi:signal transduction histidine kinase
LTVAAALALASVALITVLYHSLESSAQAEAADKAKTGALQLKAIAPGVLTNPGTDLRPSRLILPGQPLSGDMCVLSGTATSKLWTSDSKSVVATQAVPVRGGQTVFVQARSSLAPAQAAINTLRDLLIPGVPALLLLVAGLTWIAVGRALKPVSAIRSKMADITANDLHQRVPEPQSNDEIAALARTVNATLDRLQAAVEQHRRFVADAAHELRSPLATLRTRLELAAPLPLACNALTDVARLQTLTTDLLLLSRLDAGEPLRAEELDLGQITAEEATRIRPRPDVHVELNIASDVLVHGSGDQLRRLVANLVDNAVRHAESTVTVDLTSTPDQAVLEVRDDGPGIPPEHHETVFDRFARLDEARDRDHGGSGLGLAIARDIATAHGGTLQIKEAEAPGAHLRATIPVQPVASRPRTVPHLRAQTAPRDPLDQPSSSPSRSR